MERTLRKIFATTTVVAVLAGASSTAFAQNGNSSNTPADVIHPNIHDKVGNGDGTNANPNGANANGGNIHGIANNPGQLGINPGDDGTNGFANQLNTVHGGIDWVNPRVD